MLDDADILQLLKIQDLRAFGYSILEVLVARTGKPQSVPCTTQHASPDKTFSTRRTSNPRRTPVLSNRANTTFSSKKPAKDDSKHAKEMARLVESIRAGASDLDHDHNERIPIDFISLNWNKSPGMKHVFEILKICFNRHNSSATIQVSTSEIFI